MSVIGVSLRTATMIKINPKIFSTPAHIMTLFSLPLLSSVAISQRRLLGWGETWQSIPKQDCLFNKLYLSGDNLRLKDLRRKEMVCLISAAMYHFGSWRRAVESCGICYSFGKEKKMTNNSQVIPHAKKAGNKPRPL